MTNENQDQKTNMDFTSTEITCATHGKQEVIKYFLANQWQTGECKICQAERNKAKDDAEEAKNKIIKAKETEYQLKKNIRNSEIPLRFAAKSFDNFVVSDNSSKIAKAISVSYANNFAEIKKEGVSLVFVGKTGTGKTHLACAIANHVMQNYRLSVRFVNVIDAISQIKQSWSKYSEQNENDIIALFTAPNLLILDEVGVQFGTETEQMLLFRIINKRYEQLLPTIIISNLTVETLSKTLGDRIFDRLQEGSGGGIVEFVGSSHRTA